MSGRPRFVFDTDVLVSALMLSQSKPRSAWNLARRTGVILASHETLEELDSVLRRPKLAAYVAASERVASSIRLRARWTSCRLPSGWRCVAIRATTSFSSWRMRVGRTFCSPATPISWRSTPSVGQPS